MKRYYIYIMSNKKRGTLYIGSTNNLAKRVYEHKNKVTKGFTNKYNLDKLVYFEETEDIRVANQREANLKHWYRDWKVKLIEENNPEWEDLYNRINM